MRKSDKLKNFKKANLLAENRYLESKGFEVESYNEVDESPMGVNQINELTINDSVYFDENIGKPLRKFLSQLLFQGNDGYLSRELIISKRLSQEEMNDRVDKVIKEIVSYLNFGKKEISKLNNIKGGELDEEYLSEDEDNLSLYKAEMKKTGDYGWTYNNGDKERAADEEIRNKKAKEGFKHNFMQKYMEQTINTTDGVYTFDNIHYLSNYGDYLVIFTRPSNDNDDVIRGHEILLWLVYDATNGYYVKDNKKDIKLTDEDSKNKVKEMLSYNKFIQPEK